MRAVLVSFPPAEIKRRNHLVIGNAVVDSDLRLRKTHIRNAVPDSRQLYTAAFIAVRCQLRIQKQKIRTEFFSEIFYKDPQRVSVIGGFQRVRLALVENHPCNSHVRKRRNKHIINSALRNQIILQCGREGAVRLRRSQQRQRSAAAARHNDSYRYIGIQRIQLFGEKIAQHGKAVVNCVSDHAPSLRRIPSVAAQNIRLRFAHRVLAAVVHKIVIRLSQDSDIVFLCGSIEFFFIKRQNIRRRTANRAIKRQIGITLSGNDPEIPDKNVRKFLCYSLCA